MLTIVILLIFTAVIAIIAIPEFSPFNFSQTNLNNPTEITWAPSPTSENDITFIEPRFTNNIIQDFLTTPSPPRTTIQNTPDQVFTPIDTPIPSITPSPTVADPTPGPGLETPFGPDERFVIQSVEEEEFLRIISQKYNSSVDTFIAANDLIQVANLWVSTLLVIFPGHIDPLKIQIFKVIEVENQITIDGLVQGYQVSKEDLIRYNSLGPNTEIPASRYWIIPIKDN